MTWNGTNMELHYQQSSSWPSPAILGKEGLVGASSMQAVPSGWDLKQPDLRSTQEGKKPEQLAYVTSTTLGVLPRLFHT